MGNYSLSDVIQKQKEALEKMEHLPVTPASAALLDVLNAQILMTHVLVDHVQGLKQ